MKNKVRTNPVFTSCSLLAICGLGLSAMSGSAAVVAGDLLLLDFSKFGQGTGAGDDSDGTWNNIIADGTDAGDPAGSWGGGPNGYDGPIATNLVRYSNGTGTGVNLSVTTSTGANAGVGGADVTPVLVSFSQTGAIPDSAQNDLSFQVQGDVTYTFSGLNDSLTYDLEFQSYIGDPTPARNPFNFVIQNGLASQQSVAVDPNNSPGVYRFAGVATDGSGNITLSTFGTGAGGDGNSTHMNAIEILAIPEPGTATMMLGGLGVFLLRRRRN